MWWRVSSRLPRAKKATEDPLSDHLVVGTDSYDDTLRDKHAAWVLSLGILRPKPGETSRQTINRAIRHMANNLIAVYRAVPDIIREQSRGWYEGANKIAADLAEAHGLSLIHI